MTGKRKRPQKTYGKRSSHGKQSQRARDMFFPPTDQIDMSQQPTQAPPVPPKPKSQKEATMPVQASEENISTVAAFSGCTPETAARYLKVRTLCLGYSCAAVER